MKHRLTLGALTRVEYSTIVDIPDDFTEDQKDALVEKFRYEIDGGCYEPDPHFWEQGECYVQPLENDSQPANHLIRLDNGELKVDTLGF